MTVLLSGAENMISSGPPRVDWQSTKPMGMTKFNKNVFLQYLRINLAELRQQIKHEPNKRRWRTLGREKEIFGIKTKATTTTFWLRNINVVSVAGKNGDRKFLFLFQSIIFHSRIGCFTNLFSSFHSPHIFADLITFIRKIGSRGRWLSTRSANLTQFWGKLGKMNLIAAWDGECEVVKVFRCQPF